MILILILSLFIISAVDVRNGIIPGRLDLASQEALSVIEPDGLRNRRMWI
jgi:hypothetical protein